MSCILEYAFEFHLKLMVVFHKNGWRLFFVVLVTLLG